MNGMFQQQKGDQLITKECDVQHSFTYTMNGDKVCAYFWPYSVEYPPTWMFLLIETYVNTAPTFQYLQKVFSKSFMIL